MEPLSLAIIAAIRPNILLIGYWAAKVGFYGGIGYGYAGDGYQGGRWENAAFSYNYNRALNNRGYLDIPNVYDRSVTAADNALRVSFNGGRRGTAARPTRHQEALASVGAYRCNRGAVETL